MRRLFSTFADGWPGLGLLLMRVVAGTTLLVSACLRLLAGPPYHTAAIDIAALVVSLLLLAGLWTPLTGTGVMIIGLWAAFSGVGDPTAMTLLASVGAALAMLGPGAWSLDHHLFGWKRIGIPDRRR